jgi:uncharacterized membrane protein
MRTRQFAEIGGALLLVCLLLGALPLGLAQSAVPYSANVTPTPFLTPSLRWTITNVTAETTVWVWGSGNYWKASAGQQIAFQIHELREGELHGRFTIGNLTVLANDSLIGSELMLSIWPWLPGLVSSLNWADVDQKANSSATGWMAGVLEIRTTASAKTYIYHQGPTGNQNTTLVYDLQTGILLAAYTEIYIANDYHLGLQLSEAALLPTPLALLVVGASVTPAAILIGLVVVFRRSRRKEMRRDPARSAALVAILAATALTGNYALIGLPNVELSSVMVFLSGYLFGIPVGASVGLFAMTIFEFLNPWGPFIPPIGLAVIGCTMLSGILGGAVGSRRRFSKHTGAQWYAGVALLGALFSLFFDLVTNYAYSATFGVPYLVALVMGLPFSAIHVISNLLLFGMLTPPVLRAAQYLRIEAGTQQDSVPPESEQD